MKDATEIVIVLDKSGSMYGIKDDTIGGFNNFLQEQQKESGEANLTLIQFDSGYRTVYLGKPIKQVEPLNKETYVTGGNTALNDSLASAILQTGMRLEALEEQNRPDKVIVVVITDGQENSSKEHSKQQLAEMVKHQEEKYDWAFLFFGADIDSFREARKIGISGDAVMDFSKTQIKSAYLGASHAVSSFRVGGKKKMKEEETSWKSKVK